MSLNFVDNYAYRPFSPVWGQNNFGTGFGSPAPLSVFGGGYNQGFGFSNEISPFMQMLVMLLPIMANLKKDPKKPFEPTQALEAGQTAAITANAINNQETVKKTEVNAVKNVQQDANIAVNNTNTQLNALKNVEQDIAIKLNGKDIKMTADEVVKLAKKQADSENKINVLTLENKSQATALEKNKEYAELLEKKLEASRKEFSDYKKKYAKSNRWNLERYNRIGRSGDK